MRDGRYIEIPGAGTHELPPLLLHAGAEHAGEDASELALALVEAEDMLSETAAETGAEELEERKFELALQLKQQYRGVVSHWQWGDSVLEWIRQCEITFESVEALRQFLHPDVWPHASRASFVTLLEDKGLAGRGVALDRAVGLRLTFRQPPPIDCFSSQFLFYLNATVAKSAYRAWSRMGPHDAALFPPDRFHFEVLDIAKA
ncbi:MAG TPA: hypothetical protein VMU19_08765 [Bryobacteraceae bacterium]|nr:hypothetical protein [Bryobacteraceae bacterium]